MLYKGLISLIFDPSAFVFLVFRVMKWEVCTPKCNGYLSKDMVRLFELQAKLATFVLIEYHLYLKEHLTDKLWILRLDYLVKGKEMACQLKKIIGNICCQW